MVDLVRKIALFSECADAERARIAAGLSPLKYHAGETILVSHDADTRALFFITDGDAESYMDNAQETLLAVFGPGDFFGELSVFGGGSSSVSVRAISDCRLLAWPWEAIQAEMLQNPRLALALLDEMAGRIRSANRHIADLTTLSTAGCILAVVNGFAQERGLRHKCEDGTPAVRVPLRVTQAQIARMSGSTRETVNRTLAPYIEKGTLAFDENGMLLRGELQ
jgi:CRP/FNR family transcriptional regulator/CRP/FNR family cyclic AMP-dependent transcriptional regulator